MDREVALGEYETPYEAELTAAYLREHGIAARVQDNALAGMNPLWSMVVGGTRIFVPVPDERKAQELVGELVALGRLDQKEQREHRSADHEQRENDAAARRALAAAVVGLFLLPVAAHLYSLWVAGHLDAAILSRRGRRHRLFALLLDGLVLGAAVTLVLL